MLTREEIKTLAEQIIKQIDGFEAQQINNQHYYRGARDGVKTLMEGIEANEKQQQQQPEQQGQAEQAEATVPQAKDSNEPQPEKK